MTSPLSEFGRFSEPALLVLISLADGSKHGYAIMEDVASLTGARLGPGTLYGAVSRLEQRGLIEALPPAGRRRPDRLTSEGESALREQLVTMRAVVATGLRRLAPT